MSEKKPANLPASIHHRLLALSRERNADFNNLLTRYALERLLFRLSRSKFSSRFVLKGALLFEIWSTEQFRTTKDADFLLIGASTIPEIESIFRNICEVPVDDDGLRFLPETVAAEEIREDKAYQGVRVTLLAMLGVARIHVQVDVGFGDAVVPAPLMANFPSLLRLPSPQMVSYTRESSIAEKFEALVLLGLLNSRMKDLFDIWVLSQKFAFHGPALVQAIEATFRRRGTPIPESPPVACTPAYTLSLEKQAQWAAYCKKTRFGIEPPKELPEIMATISQFLLPPARALTDHRNFALTWPPGGPWG
ncbi:MAG: nucleotidyl transferase AbiEii/AbiGii toxin family protein [Acidobacteria bacterium]|nr:nucleotidyl transferase AbiEii/AbiGii toxin family protein [Acidobacteriota bacterium]